MKQMQANLAMLGAIILWGTSATVSKIALERMGTVEIYTFRVLGGALVLWAVSLLLYKRVRWNGWQPLLMGFFSPGLVTFFIILGLSYTSAVNGSVVWGIIPVIQPVLARVFLKEPLEASVMVGACLSVLGISVLFYLKNQDGTGVLLGDLYLVTGVLCATASQLMARRVASTRGLPIVTTSYQMSVAAGLGLILLSFNPSAAAAYAEIDFVLFMVLCYLVLTSAGPYLLSNFALQELSVGRSALFSPLSGPIGVVFASLVFREPLSPWILISIMVALTGAFLPAIVGVVRSRRRLS